MIDKKGTEEKIWFPKVNQTNEQMNGSDIDHVKKKCAFNFICSEFALNVLPLCVFYYLIEFIQFIQFVQFKHFNASITNQWQ